MTLDFTTKRTGIIDLPEQKTETGLAWIPSPEQNDVINGLAMGYSMNAVSRTSGVALTTIWRWVNEVESAAQFRAEIQSRAEIFRENLHAIEEQQAIQATATFGQALAGEVKRDSNGNAPIEYLAAVELLRATRWKQKAGEQHKAFGAP